MTVSPIWDDDASSALAAAALALAGGAMHRNGQATYRVVVDADVLDMLTKLHWLADGAATDPHCVASAISRLLADAARSEK